MDSPVILDDRTTEYNIVTDIACLSRPSVAVLGRDVEGIVKKLAKELHLHFDGIGLAAPQIGIHSRVAIVNVFRPIILVNPTYEKRSGILDIEEGCLSFPGKFIRTRRFKNIIINSNGLRMKFGFPIDGISQEEIELECAAVQHEIDHLNGVLFLDREYKWIPASAQPVQVTNDDAV